MATVRERILAQYRSAIIGGMARTLWVHAYVAWVTEDPDENDPDALVEAQSGVDWYDLAPDTPDAALQAANELAELYEVGTDQGDIVELYAFAIHADTGSDLEMDELIGAGRPEALPGEFGTALANMAMSTGVSWFDDHKKFPLARPSFECHYDGVQFSWSGKSAVLLKHGREVPDMNAETNGLRIKVSYELITPESAENGDVEERGWDNEEGELMDNVREAVEWLTEQGPLEPSSSSFHHGIWYTHYGEQGRHGAQRNESFHITGATMSQEQRIFDGLAKARVLRGHFAGKRDQRNRRPGTRQNPSRSELRDPTFVMKEIQGSLDSEFKQKVASIELRPGPTGKVPTVEHFKRDLAANLAQGLLLEDEDCACEPHENPAGRFTDKGERMYAAVKREYEAKGDPRAAEIAARTVYAEHKKGVPGLLNVGAGRPPGVPNPGRFRRL